MTSVIKRDPEKLSRDELLKTHSIKNKVFSFRFIHFDILLDRYKIETIITFEDIILLLFNINIITDIKI